MHHTLLLFTQTAVKLVQGRCPEPKQEPRRVFHRPSYPVRTISLVRVLANTASLLVSLLTFLLSS